MGVVWSGEAASLVARAFSSGVETTLEQLADAIGINSDPLTASIGVADFVNELELELVPSVATGEFTTARVLRRIANGPDRSVIEELVQRGECSTIEFKSSLLCAMGAKNSGPPVEHPSLVGEVLKTICAFLNSGGGHLLIGIDDNGGACDGVGRDLDLKSWDIDQWQLHLWGLIEARFVDGQRLSPFLRLDVTEYWNTDVAIVTVLAKESGSFVKRDPAKPLEFFVRNGSRTDSLDLPAVYEHARVRATSLAV